MVTPRLGELGGSCGWPTLLEYLGWAQKQGCQARFIVLHENGRMFSCIRIVAPSGRSVTEVGLDQYDTLSPKMVANFDRRLGLVSPFSPPPGDPWR